jgi:hypothetical protein
MDKATVISIFPKEINEFKWTIEPGHFHMMPGTYESPSLLVVGPSSWWREIDDQQPLLEIPVGSIQIADSIVKDYCNGLVSYVVDFASPGLAYVPGEHDLKSIRKNFQYLLDKLQTQQKQWYIELVNLTSMLWSRSNGNPLVVSGDARLAAKELVMDNLDWMQNFQAMEMVRCIACGQLRNPKFPVCMHCRNVDMSHPLAKSLVFIPQAGGMVAPQLPDPPKIAGIDPDFGKNQAQTKG